MSFPYAMSSPYAQSTRVDLDFSRNIGKLFKKVKGIDYSKELNEKLDKSVYQIYNTTPPPSPPPAALKLLRSSPLMCKGWGEIFLLSNDLQFSVCSYNMGSRVDDYFQLCRHLKPSFSLKAEEEDAFRSKYRTTQNRTAELLTNQAEAYCLQEVGEEGEERPVINSLKNRGFEIVHLEGLLAFDTAIALDTSRFKHISNQSIDVQITERFKKDVAIATATDIQTGQRITFVSAHAPGFDFTKEVNDKDAADGDFYCRAIAKKLSEIGNNTIHVIGADMNANPEKWNPRFKIFSRQGFQLHRTNSHTNVNPKDPTQKEREIDFIFTRTISSIWQKIKSIFVSTIQYSATIKTVNSIGWNVDDNASDHLPIFINISSKINVSKILQLWNISCRLLSSCFRKRRTQPQITC